jgi:hypothetical protein
MDFNLALRDWQTSFRSWRLGRRPTHLENGAFAVVEIGDEEGTVREQHQVFPALVLTTLRATDCPSWLMEIVGGQGTANRGTLD